jgi:hypothetical protein
LKSIARERELYKLGSIPGGRNLVLEWVYTEGEEDVDDVHRGVKREGVG